MSGYTIVIKMPRESRFSTQFLFSLDLMKLNSTATFTFVLLFLMVSAGVVSSMGGFSVGTEALKGVRQPDSRPNKASSGSSGNPQKRTSGQAEITLLKEEDILKAAKEKFSSSLKAGARMDPIADQKNLIKETFETKKTNQMFPYVGKDKEVTIEVTAIRRQEDTVNFDVSLKNDSGKTVNFLYSFLTITDDQGRLLNGETIGLPPELAARSDRVMGTVKVSSSLLANASKVSLQLADYPDKKIQLEVSDVPIK